MNTKKVLIIEDDKSLREMYETKLKIKGFNVITAEDGEDGIKKIKTEKPNLVLLDMMMPKKNGFDVLGDIQKDVKIKKTPVIVLSNLGQESDMALAKSLGAKEYYVKSNLLLNDLVNKVEEYV